MKTKTTELFILLATLAVIALGSYVYVTHYISGLSKRTSELKQEVTNAEITYQHTQNLHAALESAAGQKDKITGYIVPANGAVDFISHLEQTADGFGLEYNTQNISQQSNDELSAQNKELLQVTFSATGAWQNIMRLIKTVESLPYGMRMDKIDMSSVSVASSTRKWSAAVMFSVVKIKDK